MSWTQISGSISALPARRGDEFGTYLWIDAGVRHEHVVAELYLPAVSADDLDGALGVATGSVPTGGDASSVVCSCRSAGSCGWRSPITSSSWSARASCSASARARSCRPRRRLGPGRGR